MGELCNLSYLKLLNANYTILFWVLFCPLGSTANLMVDIWNIVLVTTTTNPSEKGQSTILEIWKLASLEESSD